MSATPGAIGPIPEGVDQDEYDRMRRRVLWSLPTGLFVVGSRAGAQRNLMTCNWVMQVATSPKLVAVAVEEASVTRRLIEEGGAFSVSVLDRTARTVVRKFVKPTESIELDADGTVSSMQGQPVVEVAGGIPRLVDARAWLACRLVRLLRWDADAVDGVASHVLCVGEVVDVGESDSEGADPGVLRMEDTRMNYGG